MFKPGDCIHIATGHNQFGEVQYHLFVVLTESHPLTGMIALVNFNTIRGGKYDDTVICRSQDHDFLTSDSYLNYRQARIETVDSLQSMMEKHDARKTDKLIEETLLQRIQDGITTSRFTPYEVVEAYVEYRKSSN